MAQQNNYYANQHDHKLAGEFSEREKDWRNGALVYQVLVDRFAPSKQLESKRQLYQAPKVLKEWDESPKAGQYLENEKLWSHEIEFWGGDLQSVIANLTYIADLGVDVLYLNPIHYGYTNHKYDALDYKQVSPEFGSRDDVSELASALHDRGMKLVLDGVFNHMGRNSEAFQVALKDPQSPYREWFYIGEQYPDGHRSWASATNLPELNLENPEVLEHIYAAEDSVIQGYLEDGVDGWRLDVAFDIGFRHLTELTKTAHRKKPGSLVIGEIWNYPKEWFPAVDGIMNFTAREIILRLLSGEISAKTSSEMMQRMIDDSGIESMLKSWLVLDNHDTPRLKNQILSASKQRIAQILQFTLPGAPNLYYGTELGMTGGDDPEMRGPMRWDLNNETNETLNWTKQLIAIRNNERGLKIGNYREVTSENLLAFERYTDRVADTVIVLVNREQKPITETILIANSKLMNGEKLDDLLGQLAEPVAIKGGLVKVTLPAESALMLKPQISNKNGYSPYKRVQ